MREKWTFSEKKSGLTSLMEIQKGPLQEDLIPHGKLEI